MDIDYTVGEVELSYKPNFVLALFTSGPRCTV